MTIQQEAHMLIDNLPDNSVEYVVELLRNMKSSFLNKSEDDTITESVLAQRIGTAEGKIQYPDDLNKYDDELMEMFGDKI